MFGDFLVILLFLTSYLVSLEVYVWFQILLGPISRLTYGLTWYMFCGHMKRMCILPSICTVFYRCLFVILLVDSVAEFFYILDFPPSCSINCWERVFEISDLVDLSPNWNVSPFSYISFCFTISSSGVWDILI